MNQALHILKKDIRYLWIEILLALLVAGLLAFTGVRQSYWLTRPDLTRGIGAMLVPFLLPVAWWTLIVRAVHAETLTGDRQFWPTRPYAWQSLLAAKALFMLLFINVPLLVAQMVVVKAYGFSLSMELAGLLWTQLLLILVFDLPVAAIAALTTGLVQFLLAILIAFAISLLLSMRLMLVTAAIAGGEWGPIEWTHTYYSLLLIGTAALAILLWQYRTRRTLTARISATAILLLLAMGAPFSWTTAFAMQSRFSRRHIDESSLHAGLYTDFKWAARALINRDGSVSLHIPLELSGVPGDLVTRSEGLAATIEGPGGAIWRADENPWANVSTTGQLIALQTKIDGSFYQRVKDQPVRLRGYLYLTLYGNRQVSKVQFDNRVVPVRGMGICWASGGNGAPYFLVCNSAFRPSSELVSVSFEASSRQTNTYMPPRAASYSPFPAQLNLNPVTPYVSYSTFKGPLDGATVMSLEPLAHVRAAIDIEGLRLADYEARLK